MKKFIVFIAVLYFSISSLNAQLYSELCFEPCDDPWTTANMELSFPDCPSCSIRVFYWYRYCDDKYQIWISDSYYMTKPCADCDICPNDCHNCRNCILQYGENEFYHWMLDRTVSNFMLSRLQNDECETNIEAAFLPCYKPEYFVNQNHEYLCYSTYCTSDFCCLIIFKVCKKNGIIDPFPPERIGYVAPAVMTCEVDCFPFCDESMFPKISISTDINDELNQNRVNVFPNPTNGELNITFDLSEDKNLNFIVTDLNGKTLYENVLNNNLRISEMKVNLKFLRNGAYLYKIISNDNKRIIHSGKISVTR